MRTVFVTAASMAARTAALIGALVGALVGGLAGATPAPANAYCYIGWPTDGQVVAAGKPFRVWFGLRHMGVAPKGVAFNNTGHHHLLIDTVLPAAGEPIPSNRNHLHFGAGETETMLELPPGKHTLQLLMGDENHVPHTPSVQSKKITITVR